MANEESHEDIPDPEELRDTPSEVPNWLNFDIVSIPILAK
jgi:hypothetical protein